MVLGLKTFKKPLKHPDYNTQQTEHEKKRRTLNMADSEYNTNLKAKHDDSSKSNPAVDAVHVSKSSIIVRTKHSN